MAHTQEELIGYRYKAEILFSTFGEKSLKVAEQTIKILEGILKYDDSEFVAIELGYWYNVEAELKNILGCS